MSNIQTLLKQGMKLNESAMCASYTYTHVATCKKLGSKNPCTAYANVSALRHRHGRVDDMYKGGMER
ncbi:MAG: hypothetical protein ACKVOR_04515 [Flavobacteriales bacterium]